MSGVRSRWPIRRIGEIATVARGSSPRPIADKSYFVDGTIPWIKIADATRSGKYLYETKEYVNEFGASFSRKLPRGSLIVAASGVTLGYIQMLGVSGCVHDGWLYLTNFRGADEQYLYYFLKWKQEHFFRSAYGAAIQNINTEILRNTEIALPPLNVQERIASILSTYDDLIENNTRRIKILEAMVQMIYREWFVNFRFPGHEKVKMVGSELGPIPEGWTVSPIGDVVHVLGGGTPSTTEPGYWVSGDVTWYSPSDLTASGMMFVFDSSKHITRLGLEKSSARLFLANSVMMTSRATIGVVAINRTEASTNQGFITCVPDGASTLSAFQVFFWILENKLRIMSLATGATFKEINKATFRQLPILVAPLPIAEAFELAISPFCELVANLIQRNSNLRTTRDFLLPKLISGEISVEAAEEVAIEAEVTTA